jgi:hypothetical protein
MNKKAVTAVMEFLIAAVILLFITVAIIMVFYGGPQGLLVKVGDFFKSMAEKYLPQKQSIGITPPKTELPEDIKQFYINFVKTLNENSKFDSEKCYIQYTKMPKSTYQINLVQSPKGMFITLVESGELHKIIDSNEILDLKPCIVSGSEQITSNFYYNWISPGECSKGNCKIPDYSVYTEFLLNGPYDIGGELKLYDQGILYKATKNHICFIPTIGRTIFTGGKYNENGIHYSYIDNIKKNMPECKSLPQKLILKEKPELKPILMDYINFPIKDCGFIKNPELLGQKYIDAVKNIDVEKTTYKDLIDLFISGDPKEQTYDYRYVRLGYPESETLSNYFKPGNYDIHAHLWAVCTEGYSGSYMNLKDYKNYIIGVCFKDDYCFYSNNPFGGIIAYYSTSINTQSEKYPTVNIYVFEQAS